MIDPPPSAPAGDRTRDATGPPGEDAVGLRLRLYIAGQSPRSARSLEVVRTICHETAGDGYDLEVVDVLLHPEACEEAHILATPTLVRLWPEPPLRILGDLTDQELVRRALGLASVRGREPAGPSTSAPGLPTGPGPQEPSP